MENPFKFMKPEYQRGANRVIAIAMEKHDYQKVEKVRDFLKKFSVNA